MNTDRSISKDTKELLFQSCKDGSLATVKQLLTQHADLGAQIDSLTDNGGDTALIVASKNGHSGIVQVLLECGANVDKKSSDYARSTALMKASEKDTNLEIIVLLLRHGASVNLRSYFGQTALMIASYYGCIDIVKMLLEHGADCLGQALAKAILNKQNDIIELLLKHGAEIDDKNWDDDEPPLVEAILGDVDVHIVKQLLEHGAKEGLDWAMQKAIWYERPTEIIQILSDYGAKIDPDSIDELYEERFTDRPILVTATMNGNSYIVKLLLEHGAKNYGGWALTEAILHKRTEVIDLLLEHGVCVVDDGDRIELGLISAIVEASENGDIDCVKLLLKYGYMEDLEWALGRTATIEIATLLIEYGAEIDEIDVYGTTPLVDASEIGNTDVVGILLNHGAKTYLPDALVMAIKNKHTDTIKLLTQHGALVDDENWFDFNFTLPGLVEASMMGDIETIKLLLEHGAEKYLDWALEVASEEGHIEITKLLLDYGVKVDEHDIFYTAALVEAANHGHSNIVIFLLEQGLIYRLGLALRAASGQGHFGIVHLLVEYGNAEDLGYALIEASRNGHTEIIILLLKHDVFVDFQDEEQTTALIVASQSGQIETIKLLVRHGSQINLQNRNGLSALMAACQSRRRKAVEFLLQYVALVNMEDNNGLSALMIASQNGDTEITKLLLAHGAQVDLQNAEGWSPLMKASQSGHTKIVELLLKHGANVNLQANDGYHSLMAASQEDHIDVIKLLLNYGANIHLKDKMGRSAATVAKNNDLIIALFASISGDSLDTTVSKGDSPEEDAQRKQEEEAHLVAIENAIKETGTVDHTLVHGVFVGPPRSGKDSVMKRLLGEVASNISPSTGVLETAIHVKVEKSCTYAATIGQSSWTKLAYDEEALHLMKTASSKRSTSLQFEGESADIQVVDPPKAMEDTRAYATDNTHQETMQKDSASDSQSEMAQKPVTFHNEVIFLTVPNVDQIHEKRKHKTPIEIFKEAIKKKGLEGLRNQLTNSWSLYLTNTGGQMEFQELLPLLVSGPSIFFITFQLHKDLNECFQVEYELPSGESSKCYQSSLSILDSILQTLSTIAAMGTFVYKGLQKKCVPLKPKVFLIGTHKDLLNKKSADAAINNIDSRLQTVIKSTSHYREGMIQFASKSRMIFTVNNHDPSNSDFQEIRSAVEKVVEKGDYKMRSPAHWMIYSLVVRQLQNRVESYDDCFAIAKECGIKDTKEFNEALHFIHTKMGLIRYFPHEELKDFVIVDPQILFEKVTELIVETFTFENLSNHSKLEAFENMGIFNLSDFTRISGQTGQNLTPPLFAKLLEYLRIAARFQQSGEIKYFLPCALTHAQAKQSDNTTKIPSLIVTFKCGYCPKGLFGTLITYLINNEMQLDIEWELVTENIYRDEVCFQVGPYDTVTIRFLPTHLEITCIESNSDIPRINCTEEAVCQEVYQSVDKGIKMVTSAIKYINAQQSFTFYCTSERCRENPHPAKLMRYKGKLCSLKCEKLNKCFPLPSEYEKWQLDSIELCHSLRERLNKCYFPSLISQLSICAAKWREIGTHLEFQQEELNIIETRPLLVNAAPKSWLSALISEWMEWAPGDSRGSTKYANLRDLKSAVSKAGFGVVADGLSLKQETAVETGQSNVSNDNKRKSTVTEEEPNSKKPRLDEH